MIFSWKEEDLVSINIDGKIFSALSVDKMVGKLCEIYSNITVYPRRDFDCFFKHLNHKGFFDSYLLMQGLDLGLPNPKEVDVSRSIKDIKYPEYVEYTYGKYVQWRDRSLI